jgi:hypothetical protein
MAKARTISALLKQAQKVFNRWVRHRDRHRGCISCGAPIEVAGHYYSAGHYSAIRLNELNVNGQCTRCNRYLRGNLINYRKGLVKKYGGKAVEKLELSADLRRSKRWTRFELEHIIRIYGSQLPVNKINVTKKNKKLKQ